MSDRLDLDEITVTTPDGVCFQEPILRYNLGDDKTSREAFEDLLRLARLGQQVDGIDCPDKLMRLACLGNVAAQLAEALMAYEARCGACGPTCTFCPDCRVARRALDAYRKLANE